MLPTDYLSREPPSIEGRRLLPASLVQNKLRHARPTSCRPALIYDPDRECARMPRFFFHVRNGLGDLVDREGTELPDIMTARTYARDLARELMMRNEARKRHWHVVICDADGHELFDFPFVSVDESIRHLNAKSRRLNEVMCEKGMALAEALFESRMTVLRTRATVARSRARPYVAADRGHAVVGAKT